MPIYTPGKLVLRKIWQPMDADAAAYITAVEAADTAAGQSGGLEEKTKIAIDNFVIGCKQDGIWSAIKASCILAGARTLNGALVPLVGAAPTNVSNLFVAGDYDRKIGLLGASGKSLDSNRNNNAESSQNNRHLSVYVTAKNNIIGSRYIGTLSSASGYSRIEALNASTLSVGINTSGFALQIANIVGFMGASRASNNNTQGRSNKTTSQIEGLSVTPINANIIVFNGIVARIAFYSIGESLDLALLDARVTDLINAFGAAIP